MGKDRDVLRDGGEDSDLPEEKVRRVPAGGEGWDRKMKRKRSVGSVFARSTNSDGEAKRIMHHKLSNESGLQSYDTQGFSTGSLNGTGGINKFDGSFPLAGSNQRTIFKNELEKGSLTRDFSDGMNKERLLAKANNKLNLNNDNHIVGLTKGKASRAPRTGSVMAANSSPNFSRTTGTYDGWEEIPNTNKVHSFGGTNNRKRSMPAESSSPPMAQWVGQRPQKFSRTRRANVVSPVSNHDEMQMSSEVGHTSDFGTRLTSAGSNGSLAKDLANGNQLVKVKYDNVSSPARLSESEESGACANFEGRPKEKVICGAGMTERSQNPNVGSSVVLLKKSKLLNKENTGDGLRRQGRIGRGASSSRASISPVRDKLESPPSAKPLRSTKPIPDKNGSKSGRPPLKRVSDRKSFTRVQTANGGSPDFTGESDDDQEEMLSAANYARNASYLSCSSSFWKKLEPVFASVCMEDLSNLKQKLKPVEELHENLLDFSGDGDNTSGNLLHREDLNSELFSEECEKSLLGHIRSKKEMDMNLADEGLDNGSLAGTMERGNQLTPLYQRVLSSLILEDEYEELEDNIGGSNLSFLNGRDRSPGDTCLPHDFDPRNKDIINFDSDSLSGFQSRKQSSADSFSCNGNVNSNGITRVHSQLYNGDFFQGSQEFMNSEISMFSEHLRDNDGKLAVQANASGISVLDSQYQQLCLEERLLVELQSIGLYPETVPDLADGEDEAINQDIINLQKGLYQQNYEKKAHVNKIIEAVEEGKKVEGGTLEQVAMDKLVELAYIKLLATRGSCASKYGVPKVSKQVAMAFMKRTLSRCRKFEDAGKSCFSEPPLRDAILAESPRENHTGALNGNLKSSMHHETPESEHDLGASGSFLTRAVTGAPRRSHDSDFAKSRPLLNRGKKKELLLDDVGTKASFRATLPAGTKGKRSERERENTTFSRNPVSKAGRHVKGDRKTKLKPKQKTAQLSASVDGISKKFNNKKRETGPNSYNSQSRGTADANGLQDLSLELGIASDDMDNHQDLNNLFNFDEDGLPDNDMNYQDFSMDGLEIPMDDLSEIL
ncbi:uncharacterized protein LOC126660137 isoform X2 [Mercurialis annua]|nr:uncharacterized protein LOC126660137 isoform X2 [Mercurialis annua]